MYAGLEEPRVQPFAERGKCSLGAAVQIVRRAATVARHRRNHRQCAALLRFERIGDRRQQCDHGHRIRIELANRDIGIGLAGRLVGQRAGRNQHDIQRAEFARTLPEHPRMLIQMIDIQLMASRQLGTARRQIICDLLEAFTVAGHEKEAGIALLCPFAGASNGDRRRGANDKNVFHV